MKKVMIIGSIVIIAVAGVLSYLFLFSKQLSNKIVIPYIAHQRPRIDPHVPSAIPIADKLDEVIFDGIFNISANPSGIVYEDGLGEFMSINEKNAVSIRLKPKRTWHSSFNITMKKEKITVAEVQAIQFTAKDLKFTLRRIQRLGSISPDFILVSQAVPDFDFIGPDDNNEITFQFRSDRIWTEGDIKEVLSFKVLPFDSELEAPAYKIGTGPYMEAGEYENSIFFHQSPDYSALVPNVILKPFIDNSTYSTELKNRNINTLLSSPFGGISPILGDTGKYFYKSSISTCFFAVLFNVNRLTIDQRIALRSLIDNKKVMDRFFRTGTEQQRHIANYRGEGDNYEEYLNNSIFPTTSYYIEDEIVTPLAAKEQVDLSILPDTIRIQTSLNHDFKEELVELVEILNDPSLFGGKIKVTAVQNEEIGKGDYDAVLVSVSGYRSNFLFDLYNIFLREPDFENYRVHLLTTIDNKGKLAIDPSSFQRSKNYFGIDLTSPSAEQEDFSQLLKHIFGFMSTHEVGDKQVYAQMIDQLDQKVALGSWLFSLPSLAYFSTQFDQSSIDLYGTASQLSTIEKWGEKMKK